MGSTWSRVAGALVATAVAALVVLHATDVSSGVGQTTYLVATVGSAVVAAASLRRRGSLFRVRVLLTLGLAASALGDVAWQAYVSLAGAGPDVSLADVGWLASYGFIGWALVTVVRRSDYRLRRDPEALIDMSMAAVLVALGTWMLWVAPTLADATTPLGVRAVWAVYPVLDAALLALLVRMLVRRTVRGPAVALLAAGLALWFLSDLGYLSLASWSWSAAAMDVGWMVGAALVAASVWTLEDVDEQAVTRRRSDVLRRPVLRWRIVAAVVPLAAPWAIELWAYRRGWTLDPLPLVLASIALGGLVCARTLHMLRLQQEAEQLYRAAALHSSDATLIVSRGGLLLHDAPGLATLLGRSGAGRSGSDVDELMSRTAGGRRWFDDVVQRVVQRPGAVVEDEVELHGGDGTRRWLSVRVVNLLDAPGVNALLVNVHDVTDRKLVEAELERQAFHDHLTGLPNRALFSDRLEHAFAQRERSGIQPSVLMFDLDHFKAVNDRFGHDAGDSLLVEVSQRLRAAVRTGDTVARLGGDEFAVLIEGADDALEEARSVAERVLDLLATPVELDQTEVTVTASIGIAPGSPSSDPSALLRDADTAMYHAKAAGRAQAIIYNGEMRARDELLVRVEADLPGAVSNNQLRVEYQPVVDLSTGGVTGFEALLRWSHPELGEIAPEVFIPIAEQTGVIVDLGRWVLATACDQLARWRRDLGTELSVAVNVSGRQLADPHFSDVVLDTLVGCGLAPEHLVLEITETTIISDTDEAHRILDRLRGLGVRFAIDDFGTGYSALSYLQQLPIDILKIDRSFISHVREGHALPDIVRGILDLAHSLRLQTVAEGIESTAQLDQLRSANCEVGQGFLFSQSLSAETATELLATSGAPVAGGPGDDWSGAGAEPAASRTGDDEPVAGGPMPG